MVAVAGLGTIGKITLRAFKEVLPKMKTVKLYDPMPQQAEKYIETMKAVCPNVEFVVCPDVKKACEDADVVTTCAPILEKPNRIITTDMLKKDVFCMTSDYDSTFAGEVANKGRVFVCDDRNQYLWTQEHGVYFQNGYPLAEEIYADMGEVVSGKAAPVREGRRTCLFMGIASHDVMTAKLILGKAAAQNAGTMLKLRSEHFPIRNKISGTHVKDNKGLFLFRVFDHGAEEPFVSPVRGISLMKLSAGCKPCE